MSIFESIREYAIDRSKHCDIKLGGAKRVCVTGCAGEKVRVRLASDRISTVQSDFALEIDDNRDCLDLDLTRLNGMTEAAAKEALTVFVELPEKYICHVELAADAESVEIANLACEDVELDGKASRLLLDGVNSHVEVNCNLDMDVVCRTFTGKLTLNQVSADSRLTVPQGCAFRAVVKGLGNSVRYEMDGKPCADFSSAAAETVVELNGMKSTLVIAAEGGAGA